MAKSTTFDNQLLQLIFNGTAITGLANNATTGALTNLYVALHTADPGAAGTQATSEASYVGYSRIAVVRSTGGWSVAASAGTVSPVANIQFPACTSGSNTITNWSIGTTASGATEILYTGTVSPNISVTSGTTPILTTASTVTES